VTSPISPGSSGGPVLNNDGDVIGVAVAMREDGQAINFAVPARDVAALLGSPAGRLAFPAMSDRNGRASTASGPARADRAIALGETKEAALTSEDPQLDDGEYYHSYAFEGEANDRIVVSLRSTSFDTYLAIFTTDGAWEDQDDDSGGDSNAELNVTLPRSGMYVIVVTSYAGEETGRYELTVRESDGTEASEASEDDSGEWTMYGRTADDIAELFYLPTSVRRYEEDVFEVWTRWVYSGMQPPSTGDEPYDSEKRLMRVDCSTDRLGMVSFVEYSGESVVNSHTIRNVEMTPAVPESVGASLLRMVCSNQAP
ncbi:MAG TPA: S1C family serine protease, partial [Longimicrobiales bacterium]|nr:S1C family serine protease [Longimicrobiales bacterium]